MRWLVSPSDRAFAYYQLGDHGFRFGGRRFRCIFLKSWVREFACSGCKVPVEEFTGGINEEHPDENQSDLQRSRGASPRSAFACARRGARRTGPRRGGPDERLA